MSAVTLQAGRAAATVLPARGGLVASLTLAPGGKAREVLWMPPDFDAGESGWPGGGVPLCFPFAGRVFHQGQPFQYELDGVVRHMPIHGFAYGMPWDVVAQGAAAVTMKLGASAATQALYPFAFELVAEVALREAELSLTLTAKNAGKSGSMPVAMGLHPYFVLPQDGELAHTAATHVAVTNAGGAGKATRLPPGPLPLAAPLSANAILADHAQPRIALVDTADGRELVVGFSASYRYVVLWRKEGAGFQCVEPWMGLPDAVSTGAGVVWLQPGDALSAQATLTARG
jgi:galactose mutarotase-like enzyme